MNERATSTNKASQGINQSYRSKGKGKRWSNVSHRGLARFETLGSKDNRFLETQAVDLCEHLDFILARVTER